MATVADIVARQGPPQDVRAYPDAREFDLVARPVPANDVVAYRTLPGTPPVAVVEGGAAELDVPAAALVLTGYAPTLAVALDAGAAASLALTGYAPSVEHVLTVGVETLALTGYAPALSVTVDAPLSSLVAAGYEPSLSVAVDGPAATLALTGFAPALAVSIDVGAGSLAVVGYAPSLSPVLDLGAGTLALTGYSPTLATVLDLTAGALTATGYAPALAITVDLGAGALALTGYAPALAPTLDLGAGVLTLTGYDPTLEVAAPADTGPTPRQRESLPPLDLRTAAVGYDRTVRTELSARSGPLVGVPRASTTDVRYRLARAGYEGADMASFFWGTKDPADALDYAIDWTGALNGDTIATSTFVVAVGAGLTINSQSNTTTSSTVWLSGGTAGTVYEVTCTITTAGARTFERTAQLTVADL